jgi:chromosome segregation ATPase
MKYLERFGTGDGRVGLPGLSPQLVQKQHEMEKTNSQLEEARNKFETWKTNFQRKKKEIDEKQAQLAEQKRHLDAFTTQQMVTLEKAKKREAEEIEQARTIDAQLKTLMEEEEQLKAQNDALRTELDILQPCADYLQSVVEFCPQFDNIESILNRHQSLATTRAEYLQKYRELMERYGTDEAQLAQQLEVRRSHLIDCTMKYNEGIARVAQAKKRNEYRKTTLIKVVQRIEDKNVELSAIKTSIRTIYNRALARSTSTADHIQRAKGAVLTEEAMLEYIENRFNDLKDIIEDKKVVYIQNSPDHVPSGAAKPAAGPPRRGQSGQ